MSLRKDEQELIDTIKSSIKSGSNLTGLVNQELPKTVSADFILELDDAIKEPVIDEKYEPLYQYLHKAATGLLKSIQRPWLTNIGKSNDTDYTTKLATYMALRDKYARFLRLIDEQKQK